MSWQLPSPVDLMAFQWLSSTIFLQNFLLSCPNFPWMCINWQVSFLLKFDLVVPIPKKASDLSQPSNYRSISLFPITGKIFEPLINTVFVNFLESQHLLSDMQYGFRHSLSSPTWYLAEHISRDLLTAVLLLQQRGAASAHVEVTLSNDLTASALSSRPVCMGQAVYRLHNPVWLKPSLVPIFHLSLTTPRGSRNLG